MTATIIQFPRTNKVKTYTVQIGTYCPPSATIQVPYPKATKPYLPPSAIDVAKGDLHAIKAMLDLVFGNTHTDINRALREMERK